MGAPSQDQIDEAIADGLARGKSEEAILAQLGTLERLSDEELAANSVHPREAAPAKPDIPFEPAPLRRRVNGWTAERQREFIAALAETGCVSEACAEVGITARSAYGCANMPRARRFVPRGTHAQHLAATRLTALAWERAIHGGSSGCTAAASWSPSAASRATSC